MASNQPRRKTVSCTLAREPTALTITLATMSEAEAQRVARAPEPLVPWLSKDVLGCVGRFTPAVQTRDGILE